MATSFYMHGNLAAVFPLLLLPGQLVGPPEQGDGPLDIFFALDVEAHPTGSALCLFYLLLLSVSEHAPFGFAYLLAAAATVLMIGGYSIAILRGALRALLMTLVLGGLYGYLYVLLQLEDYALLLGSLGLFAILALVMYLTRRIDWSAPRRGRTTEVSTAAVTPR